MSLHHGGKGMGHAARYTRAPTILPPIDTLLASAAAVSVWKVTDRAGLFAEQGGTGSVAAGGAVGLIPDLKNTYDWACIGDPNRAVATDGLTFDGVNDGYYVISGFAGTASMTFLAAIKTTDTAAIPIAGDGSANHGAVIQQGAGAAAEGAVPGSTVWVDGVQVLTRAALYTAIADGAWHIFEQRNMNLTPWPTFGFSYYDGWQLGGQMRGGVLIDNGQAGADATRAAAYSWLAGEVTA